VPLQEAMNGRPRELTARHETFCFQQLPQHVDRATRVLALGREQSLLYRRVDLGSTLIRARLGRQSRQTFPLVAVIPRLKSFLSDLPSPAAWNIVLLARQLAQRGFQLATCQLCAADQRAQQGQSK
jgi:hypothetical protein